MRNASVQNDGRRRNSTHTFRVLLLLVAAAALTVSLAMTVQAGQAGKEGHATKTKQTKSSKGSQLSTCPFAGWAEGLSQLQQPGAAFPTQDTANNPPDCAFQQWSWEAFVWAMAPQGGGAPRFLSLPTEDDLANCETHSGPLKLAARSLWKSGAPGGAEGAGAIVQADGNMMVGPGGYPVYASVHMNKPYCTTAKQNKLQKTPDGQYKYPQAPYFPVGAAVFKATWIRVVGSAPAGSYTTQAQVPNLKQAPPAGGTISPAGTFTTVKVALVGLHVVGYTVDHPEFLWGTFEHNLNTPASKDFTFQPSPAIKCGTAIGAPYTFCPANTPYSAVNLCAYPGPADPKKTGCPLGGLTLTGQTVAPITFAVQENATGGNTEPNGPQDINNVNAQGQSHVPALAAYHLVGTTWLKAGTFNPNSTSANAKGSVNLTNTTAETFRQSATRSPQPQNNCFACHFPGSNNYQPCPGIKALPNHLIAVSHVITLGTPFATENQIPGSCPAAVLLKPGMKK